jgi:hypothetical protein
VTIPELLDWCQERHEQSIYFRRDRAAGQVTLFADDGALTIPAELWDEFTALLAVHRPDVKIDEGLS